MKCFTLSIRKILTALPDDLVFPCAALSKRRNPNPLVPASCGLPSLVYTVRGSLSTINIPLCSRHRLKASREGKSINLELGAIPPASLHALTSLIEALELIARLERSKKSNSPKTRPAIV